MLSCSLLDKIQKNEYEGFSLSSIKNIAEQLLKGVSILHQSEIIHNDLKPENILFVGNSQNLKLIDFGLSCLKD